MARINFKNLIVAAAFLAATFLAITDTDYRQAYFQLISTIIGGYFGLSLPSEKD